ncbi:hypothetical protein ABKN59_003452 [Abortiporus biennis]
MLSRSHALLFKSARSVAFGPVAIVRASSTAATPGPDAPKKRSAPRAQSLGDVSLERPKFKGFADNNSALSTGRAEQRGHQGQRGQRRQGQAQAHGEGQGQDRPVHSRDGQRSQGDFQWIERGEGHQPRVASDNNSELSTGRAEQRGHQGQRGQRRQGQGQAHGEGQGQDQRVHSRDGRRSQGDFQWIERGEGHQPRGQQGQKSNARRERQESGIQPRKVRTVDDIIEGQQEKVEKPPVKFESVQTTDLDALFGTTNNTTIQAVTAADSGSDVSKTLIRRHGQRVLEKVGGVYKQYLPVKPRSYKGDTISTIGAAGLARVYLGRHPELTQQRREKGLALVDRLVGAQQGAQA